MKSKILKRILLSLAGILILFCVLMVTPRIWAAIFPGKPPVGYHFRITDYLAVVTGLDRMVNMKPEIPANIEEIKDIEYKNVNGLSLQLDICRPKNPGKPAPLLVFNHGGGWRHELPLWPHTMDMIQRVNDFTKLKMEEFFELYLR